MASDLAARFLYRKPYKSFEVPSTESGTIPRIKLSKFRDCLHESGIYFVEDLISHRSYKQHDVTDSNFLKNILIKRNGEPESLGSVSDLLKVPMKRVARIYFRDDVDRESAVKIFGSL
jgi:hypothetical protein